MTIISNILLGLIALLHFLFFILETFLWTTPVGLKVFGHSLESALSSKVLAANQGLYNVFLMAGIIWGVIHPIVIFGNQIKYFFLLCIVVAGVYGGFTVGKKIFFIQAAPALLGILFLILS